MDDNDLKAAAKKIHEAHDAEASLLNADSHAIHPDEAEYRAEEADEVQESAEEQPVREDADES